MWDCGRYSKGGRVAEHLTWKHGNNVNIWSWCSRRPPPVFKYQLHDIKMQGSIRCASVRARKQSKETQVKPGCGKVTSGERWGRAESVIRYYLLTESILFIQLFPVLIYRTLTWQVLFTSKTESLHCLVDFDSNCGTAWSYFLIQFNSTRSNSSSLRT